MFEFLVFVSYCVGKKVIGLATTHKQNISTVCNRWAFFAYLRDKVASLLWFALFGLRIAGDTQLLGCFHIVDHI